jgi:hypothetical protein
MIYVENKGEIASLTTFACNVEYALLVKYHFFVGTAATNYRLFHRPNQV